VKRSIFKDDADQEDRQDLDGADPNYFQLKEMENQLAFGKNEI